MILTPLKFKSISAACAVFLCLIKNYSPNFPDRRNSLQGSVILNSVVKNFTGFSAAVSALSCAARHYGKIFFTRTPFRPAHHNLLQSRPPRLPCPRFSSFCRFSLSRFSFPYLYIYYIYCVPAEISPRSKQAFLIVGDPGKSFVLLFLTRFSVLPSQTSLNKISNIYPLFSPRKALFFFPANNIRQLLYLVHSCSN